MEKLGGKEPKVNFIAAWHRATLIYFCILLVPFFLFPLFPFLTPAFADEKWEGVDKTVVEKFATEAGHPPRRPYIDTDQGDLLLFLFLIAGAGAGFIGGYAFRGLFPPKKKSDARSV